MSRFGRPSISTTPYLLPGLFGLLKACDGVPVLGVPALDEVVVLAPSPEIPNSFNISSSSISSGPLTSILPASSNPASSGTFLIVLTREDACIIRSLIDVPLGQLEIKRIDGEEPLEEGHA